MLQPEDHIHIQSQVNTGINIGIIYN